MSVETRPVPTTLFLWPRVCSLNFQQKSILAYLWHCRDSSTCGCYLLGLASASAELGLSEKSFDYALKELEKRELIIRDTKTGEIYVLDWPRWHHFKTAAAVGALRASILRIKSQKLKILAESDYKSIGYDCKSKSKGKASAEAEESGKVSSQFHRKNTILRTNACQLNVRYHTTNAGIVCWNANDHTTAMKLEEKYGIDMVAQVVREFVNPRDALPSRVEQKIIEIEIQEKLRRERGAAEIAAAKETESQIAIEDSTKRKKMSVKNLTETERRKYAETYIASEGQELANSYSVETGEFNDTLERMMFIGWLHSKIPKILDNVTVGFGDLPS